MAMELYDLQVNTINIHNKLDELGNSLQKETKQKRIEEITNKAPDSISLAKTPAFFQASHLYKSSAEAGILFGLCWPFCGTDTCSLCRNCSISYPKRNFNKNRADLTLLRNAI